MRRIMLVPRLPYIEVVQNIRIIANITTKVELMAHGL